MSITALAAPTRLVVSATTKQPCSAGWSASAASCPRSISVNNIWVQGWPWHTAVFVQWDATATLLNSDDSYFNRGFHVITMRWGKAFALDVFEDSQEVARSLAAQAADGL